MHYVLYIFWKLSFFPALSISNICKLPSIKFKSGQWGLRVKRFSFPTNRIRVPIYFHTRNLLLTVWQVAHAERPHETSCMNVIQCEIVHLKKMKNEWHNINQWMYKYNYRTLLLCHQRATEMWLVNTKPVNIHFCTLWLATRARDILLYPLVCI